MGTLKQMRLATACALALMTVPPVEAQVQESVLHSFTSGRGGEPGAGVILAPDGLYGTAQTGGTGDSGVVYKLDTAFNYAVLHNFTGGDVPVAGVIRDSAGNLYGTSRLGGEGYGAVYKLDSAGNYTVLYNFTGGADGGYPSAGVIQDSAGNLYGVTSSGGTANDGVVYKVDSAGNYTVLYRFTDEFTGPLGVILAPDGLYGTTQGGGTAGIGMVYKLDASAQYTVLHSFTAGADGGHPCAGVILTPAGNLIGTTQRGGSADEGVVFVLTGVP